MTTLPDGWRISPLSDVVDLQRGFDLPAHSRVPGPYPVLTSGEGGGWHNEGPVPGPGFIVGRATNLGRPKWSESAFWPHNTTMYAKSFRGNNPRWLFHLFESTDLSGFDSGSVQPMLNRNYIAQVGVMVPPLAEQQAIAEVLGALDDKIAANTALAASTERVLRAEVDLAWLRREDRSSTLAEFIEFNPKVSVPRGESAVYVDMRRLPESGWSIDGYDRREPRGGARFQNGDTLLARITPCLENRKTGFVDHLEDDEVGVGSTEFIVMRARHGLAAPISFLLATEARFREFAIQHMIGSSGRQRVAASDLAAFELPTPDFAWLDQFGKHVDALFAAVAAQARENRTLAATRDALLPQLMSGKLRVRDAEQAVAAAGA